MPSECLWIDNAANGKLVALDRLATVALTTKTYDAASFKINERSLVEMGRVGVNTDTAKRLGWLYAGDLVNIVVNIMGKQAPNGLHTFNNADMDQFASIVAGMAKNIIIADHESEPSLHWVWTSFDQPARISYISQKVKQLTQSGGTYKVFTDWFQNNGFDFSGKGLGLSGGSWYSTPTGRPHTSVDDYIDYFANPAGATNFSDQATIAKCGWGYSSITYYIDRVPGISDPATQSWGSIPTYLSSLCGINRNIARDPTKKILYVTWPCEDFDRISNRNRRYKPKRLDGSIVPQGYFRTSENRLQYPSNLVRDNTTIVCCNPAVTRIHSWIMPNSEDPYNNLRYAYRNGTPACEGAALGFQVGNYIGADAGSLPCPTGLDYIGQEALGYNAILQGINRFAPHQDILDNTQVKVPVSFQYKRSDQSGFTTVPAYSDGSEFARAWKFRQPFVQLWNNPATNKKILLYQDLFDEPFEMGELKLTVGGVLREFTVANGNHVNGNELKMVRFD